jgi:FkbM family methyltransferase
MDLLLEDLGQRGLKCTSILDVGANRGDWSEMATRVYPSARVCLVEPQLEMKGALEAFCAKNPGAFHVFAGAGARAEVRTLTVWDDLAGSSFLPHKNDDLAKEGRQREIKIQTIDDIIRSSGMPVPELIKLDVQGFELEALKGASSTFGRTEVYILEVSLVAISDVPGHPQFADVVDFMLARGYVAYDFAGFIRRPSDGALGQCDICFVKKDGFLRRSAEWYKS